MTSSGESSANNSKRITFKDWIVYDSIWTEERQQEEPCRRPCVDPERPVDPATMVARDRVECIGGWSFLLLALGIFCLLPGTILTGIYASKSDSMLRIIALIIFCLAILFVFIGIVLCLFWCKHTDNNKKKPEPKDMIRMELRQENGRPAHVVNTPLTVRDVDMDDTASLPCAEG